MRIGHTLVALGLYLSVVALAWGLTRAAVRWVAGMGMQDIPGERSSHVVPTPRGGGIVIFGLVSAFALCSMWNAPQPIRWGVVAVCGGAAVAAIGWLDDRGSVPARIRFLIHLVGAATIIAATWSRLSISILPGIVVNGLLAAGFVALFVTWMINLYNFMDGIDGLASGQATTVAAGVSILAFRHGDSHIALFALSVSAVALGFLLVNWSPAKVFMGDVGSGFLGYLFALLALWGTIESSIPFCSVLILMGYFIVDATWTMLRRATSGQRVWLAHRDHAYQHAVRSGLSHAKVSSAVICLNLCVLLPAALACDIWPCAQWPITLTSYGALIVLVTRYRAGVRLP